MRFNNLKIGAIALLVLGILLSQTIHSYAQSSDCPSLYGGGSMSPSSICFSLTKLVKNPKSQEFVKNLTMNDVKFTPAQTVNFQLILKNIGQEDLKNVQITDVIPDYIDFIVGSGSFDQKTKKVLVNVGNLSKGQSMIFTITGKTVGTDNLPKDKGITCVTNQAIATAQNGYSTSATSSLCIEKNVLGTATSTTKTTPATGAWSNMLFILLGLGLTGFVLRKTTITS